MIDDFEPFSKFLKLQASGFGNRTIQLTSLTSFPIVLLHLFYNFAKYKNLRVSTAITLTPTSNEDFQIELPIITSTAKTLYIEGSFDQIPSLPQNQLITLIVLSPNWVLPKLAPNLSIKHLILSGLTKHYSHIRQFKSLKILHLYIIQNVSEKKCIAVLNQLRLEELILGTPSSNIHTWQIPDLPQLNIPTLKRLEIEGAYCSELPSLKDMVKLEILSLQDIEGSQTTEVTLPIAFKKLKNIAYK